MSTITEVPYNELPDSDKQTVLDKYRTINVDYERWCDYLLDDWKLRLGNDGFGECDIEFSGFWSQGDGASFTSDRLPSPSSDTDVSRTWNDLCNAATLLDTPVDRDDIYNLSWGKVVRSGSRYHHEHSVHVDWELDVDTVNPDLIGYELTPYYTAFMQALTKFYSEYLPNRVVHLCREIYRELNEEYDYQTSDEVVAEALIHNMTFEVDEDNNLIG
jgi:hypothetical protein